MKPAYNVTIYNGEWDDIGDEFFVRADNHCEAAGLAGKALVSQMISKVIELDAEGNELCTCKRTKCVKCGGNHE